MSREDALANKYAWLVPQKTWNRLHYVEGVTFDTWDAWWEPESVPGYNASELTAACGRTIDATLPGIFSRIGCPRCAHCCDALGIPRGNGAPANDRRSIDNKIAAQYLAPEVPA